MTAPSKPIIYRPDGEAANPPDPRETCVACVNIKAGETAPFAKEGKLDWLIGSTTIITLSLCVKFGAAHVLERLCVSCRQRFDDQQRVAAHG